MKQSNKVAEEVFGQLELAETKPTKRMCILRDMLVHISIKGFEEFYHADIEGIERGEALNSGEYKGSDFRNFVCMNCGLEMEGESEKSDVNFKNHIGHKNPFLYPFEFNFKGERL